MMAYRFYMFMQTSISLKNIGTLLARTGIPADMCTTVQ